VILSITTFGITAECSVQFRKNPFMLSVVMINAFMLSVIMLNVIMLSLIMLNDIMLCVVMINAIILSVVMLSAILPSVFMLNAIMPIVIMLHAIMSSVIMLSAILPSVVRLNAIMPSVAAPYFPAPPSAPKQKSFLTSGARLQRRYLSNKFSAVWRAVRILAAERSKCQRPGTTLIKLFSTSFMLE
jgi:hypothetical protein